MKLTKTILLTLSFLLLIGAGLRLYNLGHTPESLTWDEAALGYNSFSILKTGADEYGYSHPLLLRSYDDYKPALYAYLTLPFIKFFGPTITSVRLVSALSGTFLILAIFMLVRNLTRSSKLALFAALITTFNPLFLLYSRMALEANLALTLFTFGAAFLFYPKFSRLRYSLGLFFLILSTYAYHSPRYLVPILIAIAFFTPFKPKKFEQKFLPTLLSALAFLPILLFIFNPRINTRFKEASIITKHSILFGSFSIPEPQSLLDYTTKAYFYLLDYTGRYLSYFNPYHLFDRALTHPTYFLDGHGIFNLFELPFLVFGLVYLIKNRRRFHPAIFIMLFLSPLPAVFTVDWFSPLRALILWPWFIVVLSLGLKTFLKKPLLLLLLAPFWFYQAGKVVESALIYHPYVHAGEYQYGFAQTIPYVQQLMSDHHYDHIIIDSPHAQPHMFILFFSQYDPAQYQQDTLWRKYDYSPRHNFDFGPYTFRKIYWPDDRNLKNTLFVGNEFSLPYDQIQTTPNVESYKEFQTPDGNISFRVVTTQ